MQGIISSFQHFEDRFKGSSFLQSDSSRIKALKRYFQKGGVVSVIGKGSNWPKLLYPSKLRLRSQISELERLKEVYYKKRSDWRREYNSARLYNLKTSVKKFADPLYWKHSVKMLADSGYRKDFQSTGISTKLIAEKKYRPMVDMFFKDADYRRQLTETVQNSVVYKNGKVARYADDVQEFRKGVSMQSLEGLHEKISEINADIKMLQAIIKWAES